MAIVTCCFCGIELDEAFAATMLVYPPGPEEESQTLYCHGACLIEHLDPRFPYHLGLGCCGDFGQRI